MIRHVVVFDVPERQDDELDRLLDQLALVPQQISEVQAFSCGRSLAGNSSAAIVADFIDWDSLERYRRHPAHQPSLDLLHEIATGIRVSDFEVRLQE